MPITTRRLPDAPRPARGRVVAFAPRPNPEPPAPSAPAAQSTRRSAQVIDLTAYFAPVTNLMEKAA